MTARLFAMHPSAKDIGLSRGPTGPASTFLQRKCACAKVGKSCARCGASISLQRRSRNGDRSDLGLAPPVVHQVLNSPGRPLDALARDTMEGRFSRDFSSVRIHTDDRAARSAETVEALAYTVGNQIAFGRDRYAPASSEGQRLLAHELSHVVQQTGGAGLAHQVHGTQAEEQADRVAEAVVTAGARVPELGASSRGLARAPIKPPPATGVEARAEHEHDLEHLKELLVTLLQATPVAKQGEIDRNRTIAIGLAEMLDEDDEPFQTLVYAASGNWKAELEEIAARLGIERVHPEPRAGERGAHGAPADAEQLLMEAQDERDMTLLGFVVHRPPCVDCEQAIGHSGTHAQWLSRAQRKQALGAGRLYRRGSGAAKSALAELDQAFAPAATAPGQQSKAGLGADAAIWGALNALDINELYLVLEIAQRAQQLHRLMAAAPFAHGVYNDRLLAVMSTLEYKAQLQQAAPSDSALLGALFNLHSEIAGLPDDQKAYLRKALRPVVRSVVRARAPKRAQNDPAKAQPAKAAPDQPASGGIAEAVRTGLKAAGVVLTGLALLELAEAIATALFTEFLLVLAEQGWKALPKEKIVEVVSQQVRTRVGPAAAQAEKIGEAVAREIEHLAEIPKAMAR